MTQKCTEKNKKPTMANAARRALCLVAMVVLASAPAAAQTVVLTQCQDVVPYAGANVIAVRQVRTLVDELAALSWEKSMQTVSDQDYTAALNRFISHAIASDRGLDQRDGDGRTALHWAAANGHQVRAAPFQPHTCLRPRGLNQSLCPHACTPHAPY